MADRRAATRLSSAGILILPISIKAVPEESVSSVHRAYTPHNLASTENNSLSTVAASADSPEANKTRPSSFRQEG